VGVQEYRSAGYPWNGPENWTLDLKILQQFSVPVILLPRITHLRCHPLIYAYVDTGIYNNKSKKERKKKKEEKKK